MRRQETNWERKKKMDYVLFLLSLITVLLTLILAVILWGKDSVLKVFVNGYKWLVKNTKKHWKSIIGVLVAIPSIIFLFVYAIEHPYGASKVLGIALFILIYQFFGRAVGFIKSKFAKLHDKKPTKD